MRDFSAGIVVRSLALSKVVNSWFVSGCRVGRQGQTLDLGR
jgi:hypothetical protein